MHLAHRFEPVPPHGRSLRLGEFVRDPTLFVHGGIVARHLARDAVHDVERHTQHGCVWLEPTNAWYRHIRLFEHLQHLALKGDVVGWKDDVLFRLEPCDHALAMLRCILRVDEVEKKRVARKARPERRLQALDADVTRRHRQLGRQPRDNLCGGPVQVPLVVSKRHRSPRPRLTRRGTLPSTLFCRCGRALLAAIQPKMTSTPLNEPLTLPCGAILPNRIAKAAMSEHLGSPRQSPTPGLARLYERWSAGGAGLLITGNVMVDPAHLEAVRNVAVKPESNIDDFREWAAAGTTHDNLSVDATQSSRPANTAPHQLQPWRAV